MLKRMEDYLRAIAAVLLRKIDTLFKLSLDKNS